VRLRVGTLEVRAGSVFSGFTDAGFAAADFEDFVGGMTTASVSRTGCSTVADGTSAGAGAVATTALAGFSAGVAF
jgi:hypothetical protein